VIARPTKAKKKAKESVEMAEEENKSESTDPVIPAKTIAMKTRGKRNRYRDQT